MIIATKTKTRHKADVEILWGEVTAKVKEFMEGYGADLANLVKNEMMYNCCGRDITHIDKAKLYISQVPASDYDRIRNIAIHRTSGMGRKLILSSLEDVERDGLPLSPHLQNHLDELGSRTWFWDYQLELRSAEWVDRPREHFVVMTSVMVIMAALCKTDKTQCTGVVVDVVTGERGHLPLTDNNIEHGLTRDAITRGAGVSNWVNNLYTFEDLVMLGLIVFSPEDVQDNAEAEEKENARLAREEELKKKAEGAKNAKTV